MEEAEAKGKEKVIVTITDLDGNEHSFNLEYSKAAGHIKAAWEFDAHGKPINVRLIEEG